MPCYKPLQAFRSKSGRDNTTGKWPITFKRVEGYTDKEIILPCGRCIGCRLERSRIWAIRCMHEAQLHTVNTFITLTYNDKNLPPNNSLDKTHLQKFWKKLRKNHGKLRYYACGEYGDTTSRPHYHAIVFGRDFPDKVHHTNTNGNILYKSKTLDDTWGHGNCLIGNVTFDSCAYVARYIMKKALGKDSLFRYTHFDMETGEIFFELTPDYTTMSRRPGIGKNWLDKYSSDIYGPGNDGNVIQRGGISFKAPRFYDTHMERDYGTKFIKSIQAKRKGKAQILNKDNSLTQLAIDEKYKLAQTQTLTRTL